MRLLKMDMLPEFTILLVACSTRPSLNKRPDEVDGTSQNLDPARPYRSHIDSVAGTVSTTLTYPLDLVKTRFQSSSVSVLAKNATSSRPSSNTKPQPPTPSNGKPTLFIAKNRLSHSWQLHHTSADSKRILYTNAASRSKAVLSIFRHSRLPWQAAAARLSTSTASAGPMSFGKYFVYIFRTEGLRGYYKGLLPNILGCAPSRAIYFTAYTNIKSLVWLNTMLGQDSSYVHMISAALAGFINTSVTNPLWFIRTRLQLDQNVGDQKLTVRKCMQTAYQEGGVRIFWKGVTASYAGISETVIHFSLYELLKRRCLDRFEDRTSLLAYLSLMACGAVSKFLAATVAYPHEVIRTRVRQENSKYTKLVQTFFLIRREEGFSGLYRGLGLHLLRQVPNTAILMVTYELVSAALIARQRRTSSE